MKKVEIVFNYSFSVFSNLKAPNTFLVVFILPKQKTRFENVSERCLRFSTFPLFLLVGDILVSRFDVVTTNFEANKSPTSINKFYKKYGVRIIILLIKKK